MTTEERAQEVSESFYRPETGYNEEHLCLYNGTDLEEAHESCAKWADGHPHKPTREEILKELRAHAEHTEHLYALMGQIPPIEQLAILQMEEGRKQTIEKAVDWLSLNAESYGGFNPGKLNDLVVAFKKSMEG